MRNSLLEVVVCPICKERLTLGEIELEEVGEVMEGDLVCSGGHFYPVIGGIPRLLPPELLAETLQRFHPVHFSRYRERLEGHLHSELELKKKTLQSFSYQWNAFSEMYPHWEENFKSYFEPLVKPEDFQGKRVLDAGCGFGRHAFYAGKYGAEVIAMDLSEAVVAAFENTRSQPSVHVIQGDIYQPPLKTSFDLVYCVGVIQHLPDPGKGFGSLACLLIPGGKIFVWVYGQRKGIYRLVDFMRKVTTRMSMRSLYWITMGLNYLSYLLFSLPYRLVRPLPGGRRLAAYLPFTRYADLPLRVGHADWFDRLSVPSTVYFSREEVEGWFKSADLIKVGVQSREGIGWKGLGEREALSKHQDGEC